MNKNTFRVLVFLCIIISITNHTVFAKALPDSTKGTISTTGTASDSYPPDRAEIIFAIESRAKTVSQATQKNTTISNHVITTLKSLIDKAQGDMINTSSYSIHPQYEYDKTKKKNIFVEYLVTHQITVKTGRITDIGKLIDSATEQGSNRIHSITFTISDDQNYCEQLLDEAAKKGKFEAETVARSLGTAISGIKSVSSSCSDLNRPPIYPRGFAQDAVASQRAVSIEPGAIQLVGTVSLVFFIDNSGD